MVVKQSNNGSPRKRYALKDLLAQMKPEHRSEETDWGAARGKEAW